MASILAEGTASAEYSEKIRETKFVRFFSGGASQGLIRELVRELVCRLIRELARKLDRKLARELARAPPNRPCDATTVGARNQPRHSRVINTVRRE